MFKPTSSAFSPRPPAPAFGVSSVWSAPFENLVKMCKKCLDEDNDEIKGLKGANEELKRQIQELESKVEFLSWSSPVDRHHLSGVGLEDDRYSCYAPDVVLLASDDDVKPVPAHEAILVRWI
ncbi:hypothetical protein Syun_003362 [Stephania yunnanensis]|uniref:Uncharacterized protein n=1 Tax=Stephania yunnanensis TaxID=152371 RepID=A0AAP0Q0J4_9MAGN